VYASSIELSELNWVHVDSFTRLSLGWVDNVSLSWLDRKSLGDDFLSFLLGGDLKGIVSLDSLDESLSRSGLSDMLNSDTDSLWDDSSVDQFVDNDTDGDSGDVENSSGLTVVELVWHTLMDGTIGDDIDVISNFVVDEVSVEWSSSMLLVRLREKISSSCSLTVRMYHFY